MLERFIDWIWLFTYECKNIWAILGETTIKYPCNFHILDEHCPHITWISSAIEIHQVSNYCTSGYNVLTYEGELFHHTGIGCLVSNVAWFRQPGGYYVPLSFVSSRPVLSLGSGRRNSGSVILGFELDTNTMRLLHRFAGSVLRNNPVWTHSMW